MDIRKLEQANKLSNELNSLHEFSKYLQLLSGGLCIVFKSEGGQVSLSSESICIRVLGGTKELVVARIRDLEKEFSEL